MVMNKRKVKGKDVGGAMITTNWMELVKLSQMRVKDVFTFWFRGSRDGGLKLLVDILWIQLVYHSFLCLVIKLVINLLVQAASPVGEHFFV